MKSTESLQCHSQRNSSMSRCESSSNTTAHLPTYGANSCSVRNLSPQPPPLTKDYRRTNTPFRSYGRALHRLLLLQAKFFSTRPPKYYLLRLHAHLHLQHPRPTNNAALRLPTLLIRSPRTPEQGLQLGRLPHLQYLRRDSVADLVGGDCVCKLLLSDFRAAPEWGAAGTYPLIYHPVLRLRLDISPYAHCGIAGCGDSWQYRNPALLAYTPIQRSVLPPFHPLRNCH